MKEGSGRSDALSRQEATSCVPALQPGQEETAGDSWTHWCRMLLS